MEKILMVIAPENFRDEELFVPQKILEQNGYQTEIASTKTGEILGALGGTAQSTLLLDQVDPNAYVAVVFVGGGGSKTLFDSSDAHRIIQKMYQDQKLVAGICLAPVILANAGILEGKKATVWTSAHSKIEDRGAIYTKEGVTVDENIITASGPNFAKEFGENLIAILSKK